MPAKASKPLGTDRQIELVDGRRLGYCELGDPDGKLVIFVGAIPVRG
jgi:hypothetical protein